MAHKHYTLLTLPVLLLCSLLFISCAQGTRPKNTNDITKEAQGLEIYRDGDCWIAKVISPEDSTQDLGIYIFPDSDNSKEIPDISGAKIIPPSKRQRVMLYSSVYSSALKELGAEHIIKVVGDASYMSDPYIQTGLSDGTIVDAGMQQEPIIERIIEAHPDLILVSHYKGADFSKLEKLGIPIIYMRESEENTPLGRAEWIKLIGLVAGKPELADEIFTKVSTNYNNLKLKVSKSSAPGPLVMAETMYQGTWFVAGGKSYAAQLIQDAGGNYPWHDDNSAGSLSLSFEAVLDKASESDIWLIKMFDQDLDLSSLEAMDSRYMLFKPTKSGGAWTVNTAKVPFYDETPFHPDMLLKDYISIFHPELTAGYTPRYFKRVQ